MSEKFLVANWMIWEILWKEFRNVTGLWNGFWNGLWNDIYIWFYKPVYETSPKMILTNASRKIFLTNELSCKRLCVCSLKCILVYEVGYGLDFWYWRMYIAVNPVTSLWVYILVSGYSCGPSHQLIIDRDLTKEESWSPCHGALCVKIEWIIDVWFW